VAWDAHFQDSVCDGEQLAGDGDDDEFARLASHLEVVGWAQKPFLRRCLCLWVRIPAHPASHSDDIQPPVLTHSATCDALP
jgi:hypothetical protein